MRISHADIFAWQASPEAAYFKSTDGHFGNWSFNLRRPNLHLLPLIAAEGGYVIVPTQPRIVY